MTFCIFNCLSAAFLNKQIETPDHYGVIKTCSRYELFTFDYIDTCEDIRTLLTYNQFS